MAKVKHNPNGRVKGNHTTRTEIYVVWEGMEYEGIMDIVSAFYSEEEAKREVHRLQDLAGKKPIDIYGYETVSLFGKE